jgi:hypothetical protein
MPMAHMALGRAHVVCWGLLLNLAIGILAGCGSVYVHSHAGVSKGTVTYPLGNPRGQAVVHIPLVGGQISIIAYHTERHGRMVSALGERLETAEKVGSSRLPHDVKHTFTAFSTGPPIDYIERGMGSLQLDVNHGCVGAQPYALAYGMLRQSADSAVVYQAGKLMTLHKVSIPAAFHPRGVLV